MSLVCWGVYRGISRSLVLGEAKNVVGNLGLYF